MLTDARRQLVDVVAAFKDGNQAAVAMLVGLLHQALGHPSVECGAQVHLRQWIGAVRIESGGDDDHLRCKAFNFRHDAFAPRDFVIRIVGTGRHRAVERCTIACATAGF